MLQIPQRQYDALIIVRTVPPLMRMWEQYSTLTDRNGMDAVSHPSTSPSLPATLEIGSLHGLWLPFRIRISLFS